MSHCKVNKGLKLIRGKMCSATQSIIPHIKKPLPPPQLPSNIYAQVLPEGHVVSLEVKQIHKRREPSKHYAYEVVVGWSCGSNLCVFRRYSNFFELQMQLITHHALLVGLGSSNEIREAILPTLPGKAIGRFNVKQVAQKRKERLEEFCGNILKLPSELVCSDVVTKFFTLWPDDLALEPASESIQSDNSFEDEQDPEPTEFIAIADYDPANMHQITATAGSKLQVLERRLSGWWLCLSDTEQGYLPASLLQPLEGIKNQEKVENFSCKHYVVNADYKADNPDELSLKKDQKVEVIFKSYDGWWRVKIGEATGIVPSLYLTESEHKQRKETLERNSNRELYVTPSNTFRPPPRRGTFKRKEQIVSVYSVLDELPGEVLKKSSAKYAHVKKSKKSDKKLESAEQLDEMIQNMLDISLEANPDVGMNYEMSDELVKGINLSNSLFPPANKKLPKPPKPPRRYVNPQEMQNKSSLHRSPSTPSFPDEYMNFERSHRTTILSRPINGTDRNSIKMNRDKRSASRDDGEIDYINWMPSIDPINVEDVNEYAISAPFAKHRTSHLSIRQPTSIPDQAPTSSKIFEAIDEYSAQNDSCISFKAGDRAMLIEKSEDGIWFFVRVNDHEGWTPSEYWKPLVMKKPGIMPPPSIKPTRPSKSVIPNKTTPAIIPNKTPSPDLSQRSLLDPPALPTAPARKLTNSERGPLPVPPSRSISKSTTTPAVHSPPASNNVPDVPGVPCRSKSPRGTTPVHPMPRDHSKLQAKKSDLEQYLWGKMSRKDCEVLLLKRAKQGEFIFRESPNREGELVLSMRYHYRIHHFNIKQDDTWYCIGENFRVHALSEIIQHFQKTPIASYKESGDKLIDVFLSRPLGKEN